MEEVAVDASLLARALLAVGGGSSSPTSSSHKRASRPNSAHIGIAPRHPAHPKAVPVPVHVSRSYEGSDVRTHFENANTALTRPKAPPNRKQAKKLLKQIQKGEGQETIRSKPYGRNWDDKTIAHAVIAEHAAGVIHQKYKITSAALSMQNNGREKDKGESNRTILSRPVPVTAPCAIALNAPSPAVPQTDVDDDGKHPYALTGGGGMLPATPPRADRYVRDASANASSGSGRGKPTIPTTTASAGAEVGAKNTAAFVGSSAGVETMSLAMFGQDIPMPIHRVGEEAQPPDNVGLEGYLPPVVAGAMSDHFSFENCFGDDFEADIDTDTAYGLQIPIVDAATGIDISAPSPRQMEHIVLADNNNPLVRTNTAVEPYPVPSFALQQLNQAFTAAPPELEAWHPPKYGVPVHDGCGNRSQDRAATGQPIEQPPMVGFNSKSNDNESKLELEMAAILSQSPRSRSARAAPHSGTSSSSNGSSSPRATSPYKSPSLAGVIVERPLGSSREKSKVTGHTLHQIANRPNTTGGTTSRSSSRPLQHQVARPPLEGRPSTTGSGGASASSCRRIGSNTITNNGRRGRNQQNSEAETELENVDNAVVKQLLLLKPAARAGLTLEQVIAAGPGDSSSSSSSRGKAQRPQSVGITRTDIHHTHSYTSGTFVQSSDNDNEDNSGSNGVEHYSNHVKKKSSPIKKKTEAKIPWKPTSCRPSSATPAPTAPNINRCVKATAAQAPTNFRPSSAPALRSKTTITETDTDNATATVISILSRRSDEVSREDMQKVFIRLSKRKLAHRQRENRDGIHSDLAIGDEGDTDGLAITIKTPPGMTRMQKDDWLETDLLLDAIDGDDDFLPLELTLLFKAMEEPDLKNLRKNFFDSFSLLEKLHSDLACPQHLHESFWTAHCEVTAGNVVSTILRLSVLNNARNVLLSLLRALIGRPAPADILSGLEPLGMQSRILVQQSTEEENANSKKCKHKQLREHAAIVEGNEEKEDEEIEAGESFKEKTNTTNNDSQQNSTSTSVSVSVSTSKSNFGSNKNELVIMNQIRTDAKRAVNLYSTDSSDDDPKKKLSAAELFMQEAQEALDNDDAVTDGNASERHMSQQMSAAHNHAHHKVDISNGLERQGSMRVRAPVTTFVAVTKEAMSSEFSHVDAGGAGGAGARHSTRASIAPRSTLNARSKTKAMTQAQAQLPLTFTPIEIVIFGLFKKYVAEIPWKVKTFVFKGVDYVAAYKEIKDSLEGLKAPLHAKNAAVAAK